MKNLVVVAAIAALVCAASFAQAGAFTGKLNKRATIMASETANRRYEKMKTNGNIKAQNHAKTKTVK